MKSRQFRLAWRSLLAFLLLVSAEPRSFAQSCGVCGDVNGDARVDIADAMFIAQHTVGLRASLPCAGNAEVTGKDGVDIVDALFVGQHTVGTRPILGMRIGDPMPGHLTTSRTVRIHGAATGPASVECGGVDANLTGGLFEADVSLDEGRNSITCVGRHPDGVIATSTTQVVLDSESPRIVIESPPDGLVTSSAEIEVTGQIADAASSTVVAVHPRVLVNGIEAAVDHRAFAVSKFLLQPGLNTITATTVDSAGNTGSHTINVTLTNEGERRLLEMAGNGQAGPVGEALPEALVVRLVDRRGLPLPGDVVRFAVEQGDGTLLSFPQEGRILSVVTDDQGFARVVYRLGARSGRGAHRVRASSSGAPGDVVFCASGDHLPAIRIVAAFGAYQTGAVLTELPLPLVALVVDENGNPVAGVDVTFEVKRGGGSVSGGEMAIVTTDAEGRASVRHILGPEEGLNSNAVAASFVGLEESPALFVASAMEAEREPDTTVSGLVLDNQDEPVPGVTATIIGTALAAVTDEFGRFSIANAPVGSLQLGIDGTTTSRPGTWPLLHFEMVTVCGRDNTVGMPIRMLPIDIDGGKIAGGPEDVTIEMEGVAGAELTVFANSVRFPDGSRTGRISFTQVHTDKVPMLPPRGGSFYLAFTIQPPGVRFDPPARVSVPNPGLEIGTVGELFSFDHEAGEFVSVGPAYVSEDGQRLASAPGFGITKSGWGGSPPPPPPQTCAANCDDQNPCTTDECVDGSCRRTAMGEGERCDDYSGCGSGTCRSGACEIAPASPDGTACDDGDPCTEGEACVAGACRNGLPKHCDDGEPCTDDLCVATSGGCVAHFTTRPCDDENPFTRNDRCVAGYCVGELLDATYCADDRADGSHCDDDNPCTVNDQCDEGRCVGESESFVPVTLAHETKLIPKAISEALKKLINRVPGLVGKVKEVSAGFNGSVSKKDCCDRQTGGIRDDGYQEDQNGIYLKVGVEDQPIPGLGLEHEEEFDVGIDTYTFKFVFGVVGDFLAEVRGSRGNREDQCSIGNSCEFWEVEGAANPALRATAEAKACESHGAGSQQYCSGLEVTPAEIATRISVGWRHRVPVCSAESHFRAAIAPIVLRARLSLSLLITDVGYEYSYEVFGGWDTDVP